MAWPAAGQTLKELGLAALNVTEQTRHKNEGRPRHGLSMHLGESASIIAFNDSFNPKRLRKERVNVLSLVQRCALKSVSQADKVPLHEVVPR